jgi:hypothetical protein
MGGKAGSVATLSVTFALVGLALKTETHKISRQLKPRTKPRRRRRDGMNLYMRVISLFFCYTSSKL